jgi:hypothetical protein
MSAVRCTMCDGERPAMRHKAEQRVPMAAQSTKPEGPSLKNDFETWYTLICNPLIDELWGDRVINIRRCYNNRMQAYERRANRTVGVDLLTIGKASVSFSIRLLKKSSDSLLVTLTPPATEDDSFAISCANPLFQQKMNAFAVSDIYSTSQTNTAPTTATGGSSSGGGGGIAARVRGMFTRTPSLDAAPSAEVPLRVTLATIMEKSVEIYPDVVAQTEREKEAKRKAMIEAKSGGGSGIEGKAVNKKAKVEDDPFGDDGDEGWGDDKVDEVLPHMPVAAT